MNTTLSAVQFVPLLGWPWLAALAAACLVALAAAAWLGARGWPWRALPMAALLLALAGPHLVTEKRRPLPDVALVVVDETPSQDLGERGRQTRAALTQVQDRLSKVPGLEIRVSHVGPGTDGTQLFHAIDTALADLPRGRLAGVIAITDGRVHDVPADGGARLGAPLHVLLTGRPDERDRRIVVVQSPAFALVGHTVPVKVRVDDPGRTGNAPITVRVDGGAPIVATIALNRDAVVDLPVRHAGSTVLELDSPVADGDLSPANNRAAVAVTGIRDRLKVLLISGLPHAGERAWRNLLKADPAVDLIHFTILRPAEKDDRTPINELALITFPVRELFEDKLRDFDLVVFDRYRQDGVLTGGYTRALSDYVRRGGALLVAAGPESVGDFSALTAILPAHPDGRVIEQSIVPQLTEAGRRHPVTAGLAAPAPWGPWLRQLSATAPRGQVLLTGAEGKPLVVLDRVGDGRVAQVLSDTMWLWARGYQGGGPHDELLRRLAHWLMREPDLEEDALSAEIQGASLRIERRSPSPVAADATVTAPDGHATTVALTEAADGRQTAAVPATLPGLWRVDVDGKVAMAALGGLDNVEMNEVTATPKVLAPVVRATNGSARFLVTDGVPDFRKVARPGGGQSGPAQLIGHDDHTVEGVQQVNLLPLALALLAALGGLLAAWWRESR